MCPISYEFFNTSVNGDSGLYILFVVVIFGFLRQSLFLCVPFGTFYVNKAGLELTEISLPLPPERWD